MLRARAAAFFVLLAAGCSTGQSDQMAAPPPPPPPQAAEAQAVGDGAAASAAAPAAALPKEAPKPAATAGPSDTGGEPGSQKADDLQPGKSGGGGGGSKQRVFAAVVKGLQGSLTEEQVTKTVATVKDSLQACFSNTEARLEVSLQIAGGGDVGNAGIIRSDPVDPRKSDCAAARLSKLKFPPPGQSLKLELAIYLEPK